MTKLNLQTMVLNRFLLLASVLSVSLSCNSGNKSNPKIAIKEREIQVKVETEYDKDKVIKELIIKDGQFAIFLLEEFGELGNGNFEKYIEVLIQEGNTTVESLQYSNVSILCDLELFNPKILEKTLVFGIIDSCDGEEPDDFQLISWNGNKLTNQFEIPKYFENEEDRKKVLSKILSSENLDDKLKKYVTENIEPFLLKR